MLAMIGAKNYDQLDDLRNVQVSVDAAIEKLKLKWRTNDIEFIKSKIKQSVTRELIKLEERKYVRREKVVIDQKKKLQKEKEEENADLFAARSMNTSHSSPFKAGGV